MKKIIAFLLCLVMMLAAACGEGDRDEDKKTSGKKDSENITTTEGVEDNTESAEDQPTAEEWEAIDKFRVLMNGLDGYTANGYIYIEYSDFDIESDADGVDGREALAFCYDQLTKLEAVDKWVGTDWIDAGWDRQTVLDSFVIVEDVLLSETRTQADYLGNQNTPVMRNWVYNADGKVQSHNGYSSLFFAFDPLDGRNFCVQTESNPCCVDGQPNYVYGENGELEKIEYGTGKIDVVRNMTYEAEFLTGEEILFANGEKGSVTYSYDGENRLVQIEAVHTLLGGDQYKFVYVYGYDGQRNIISEAASCYIADFYNDYTFELYNQLETVYTYKNGKLSGGACTFTDNYNSTETDEWTYQLDEKGRVSAVSIHFGDTVYQDGGTFPEDQPFGEIVYEYGDYYIYTPAG